MQASGGVQDDHVVAGAVGRLHGQVTDVHRFLAGLGVIDPTWQSAAKRLSCSMAAGRCTSAGTRYGWRPWDFRRLASLAAVVVLPEPCRPTNMRATGGFPERSSLGIPRQERGQLLVDDLDHLLGRSEGFEHLFPHGPLPDLLDKTLGDLVIDVGLEQASLTSRRASVTWASVRCPRPLSFLKTWASLSESRSNIRVWAISYELPYPVGWAPPTIA